MCTDTANDAVHLIIDVFTCQPASLPVQRRIGEEQSICILRMKKERIGLTRICEQLLVKENQNRKRKVKECCVCKNRL